MTNKKLLIGLVPMIAITAIVGYLSNTEDIQKNNVQEQVINTILVDIPFSEYENIADYAIVGKVVDKNTSVYIDNDLAAAKYSLKSNGNKDTQIFEKTILTDITLAVEEDLFGKYTEPIITVRVPGGEIPGYKTEYRGSPDLEIGERVTVFVGHDPSYLISENQHTILGLQQGVIKMDEIAKSKYADETTTEQDLKNKIRTLTATH